MSPRNFCSGTAALLLAVSLAGCARDEIQTYKVAKEKSKPQPAAETPAEHAAHAGQQAEMPAGHPPVGGQQMDAGQQLPAGHPKVGEMPAMGQAAQAGPVGAAPAAAGDLVWTAPDSWQAKPLGQMRRGSYGIKTEGGAELDLSIFVFPGAAGGTVDNINRWRGQIGLGPIAATALADESTPLRSDAGLDLILVDLHGSGADSILGAILPLGGQSWFFKLRGPTPLVQKQKDAFVAFLKTVKTR